ncbi:hypothetical protein AYI68_g4544 [Smittium mucronatum]|uniref:Uncharacterized protein n=1 Tax=Smittium mucronatum TaxID=133383 RepID=A0A1R0GWT6_9FUNG|nr:hypothetical protein AYI68_g4544 [Smittium mucronatum]
MIPMTIYQAVSLASIIISNSGVIGKNEGSFQFFKWPLKNSRFCITRYVGLTVDVYEVAIDQDWFFSSNKRRGKYNPGRSAIYIAWAFPIKLAGNMRDVLPAEIRFPASRRRSLIFKVMTFREIFRLFIVINR